MKGSRAVKIFLGVFAWVLLTSQVVAQDVRSLPKSMQVGYKSLHVNLPKEEISKYAPITSYSPESDTATNLPTYDNINYNHEAKAPTMPVNALEVDVSGKPNSESERTYFLDERGRPVYDTVVPANFIKKRVRKISPQSQQIQEQKRNKQWKPVSSIIQNEIKKAPPQGVEESTIPNLSSRVPEDGVVIKAPEKPVEIIKNKVLQDKTETKKKSEPGKIKNDDVVIIKPIFFSSSIVDSDFHFEVASADEAFTAEQIEEYRERAANDPDAPAFLRRRPVQSNPNYQQVQQRVQAPQPPLEGQPKWQAVSNERNQVSTPRQPEKVSPVVNNNSMESFLAVAYQRNPQLTALREAIKAADEGLPQAISGFLPRADINLTNSLTRSSNGVSDKEDFYPDTQSLDISQSVFGGGETYYQIKAAKDRVSSAKYELRSEEQKFLRQAVEAYINLIFTRKVYALSQKNESALTENLNSTRQRFSIGDTTRTDVAQSEARLANAVSNRVSAENDYINAKSNFKRIFLVEAPENLAMPVNLPSLPKDLNEALSVAIKKNPEIQRNLYTKSQRNHEVEVQRSQLYPQVDLNGSISQRESVSGNSLFNNEQESIGVNVRVPLYDSGIAFSRTREAKDRKNQSEYEYQSTILEIRDSVVKAWQALASASLNIEATKAALLAAQYALDGVKEEQREGQRAIFEILDAQREMFNAETSHARAIRDSVLAIYNLKASIGEISPFDINLPVEEYNPEEHYNNTKFKFFGF